MSASSADVTFPREISDDEVAAFREQGWALLPQLITPETAEALRQRIESVMAGHAGEEQKEGVHKRPDHILAMFKNCQDPSLEDDALRSFVLAPETGRAASRIMSAGVIGEPEVRFWGDEAFIKMPATEGGAVTAWHQDWPYLPFDRGGVVNFWIALVDVPPERGALRFVTGSNQLGPLGRRLHVEGGDLLEAYPAISERLEISPELTLKAGDATVHDWNTMHYAPANTTTEPRWGYSISYFPADTLYTGATQRRTDGLGLTVNEPLEHARFPVIA